MLFGGLLLNILFFGLIYGITKPVYGVTSLSMDRWIGKVAVVTGASHGIGAGVAARLVENGLIVAGIDPDVELTQKRADELSGKKGSLVPLKADLTNEDDILKAFKWINDNLGPVHILIYKAEGGIPSDLSEGTTEEWKKTIDLNVLGLSIATREAIRSMQAANVSGHIVHINNLPRRFYPPINVHREDRMVAVALAETLRQELKSSGSKIKVTSLVAKEVNWLLEHVVPERKAMFEKAPLLKPTDIANAVVYVLSTPEHVQVQELMIE